MSGWSGVGGCVWRCKLFRRGRGVCLARPSVWTILICTLPGKPRTAFPPPPSFPFFPHFLPYPPPPPSWVQGETLAAATAGTPWRFEVKKAGGKVRSVARIAKLPVEQNLALFSCT